MPLLVICGLPASGKSTRANQLKDYFVSRGKCVHMVSEQQAIAKAGFNKNEVFTDDQQEKQIRSDLKSDVVRLLDRESLIILDAGNYIKGFRYELFCATKSTRGNQCTLFCAISSQQAWQFNLQRYQQPGDLEQVVQVEDVAYTKENFDALCMRFEEPQSNCRWDSPLFVSLPEDDLQFEHIYTALYESKPLPPNQSTQNPPLTCNNYVFELDRMTRQIICDVLDARKIGVVGPITIKNCKAKVTIVGNINTIQLNRLRRQFLNYHKLNLTATNSIDEMPQLFVQFLNANCLTT